MITLINMISHLSMIALSQDNNPLIVYYSSPMLTRSTNIKNNYKCLRNFSWESIIAVTSRLRRSRVVNPGYDVLIGKLKKFPMRNEKCLLDPGCLIPRLYLLLFLDRGTQQCTTSRLPHHIAAPNSFSPANIRSPLSLTFDIS